MLSIFRVKELFVVIGLLYLIRFGFFQPFEISSALSNFQYTLLVLAVLCLGAGGALLIHVSKIERMGVSNSAAKPATFTINQAYAYYAGLTITGVAIGFYLSNYIQHPSFSGIFIIAAILIYVYATYLKYLPFVNVLIVGLLVFLTVLLPGIFDLIPTGGSKITTQRVFFSILLDYAIFAFLMTLIIESVKDCRDINKDLTLRARTLPMVLGRERTSKVLVITISFVICLVSWYAYHHLFRNTMIIVYVLLFIQAPLLLAVIKGWTAETTREFNFLYKILIVVIVATVLSFGMYPYILNR